MKFKSIILFIILALIGFVGGFSIFTYYIKPVLLSLNNINIENQQASVATADKESIAQKSHLEQKVPETTENKNIAIKKKITDCPTPKKEYEDYTYLNVGQKISIPDKTYVPSDLILLDKNITTSNICLKKDAAEALLKMINKAKEDGYEIKVTSGFRSYSTQKLILENSIKLGNKNARRLIAKPGYSEHQLGVAIDLTGASIKNVSATTKFKDSVEDKWLEENAKDYGFVESYPEKKEDITGYMNEDWHYRYVGIDNAKEIINKKQTTNEFLKEKLEEESLQNKITQTTE